VMHQTREFVEGLCFGKYQSDRLKQYHDKKTTPREETMEPAEWLIE
jgi:hypothetical protein